MTRVTAAIVAASMVVAGAVAGMAAPAWAATTTAVTIDVPSVLVPSPATLGSVTFVGPDEGGPNAQPANVFVTLEPDPVGQNGVPPGAGTIGIGLDPSSPLQNCDATYVIPFCEWEPNSPAGLTAILGLTLTPSSDASGLFILTVGVDNGEGQRTTFRQQVAIGAPAGSFAASVTTSADTQLRPNAAVLEYSCGDGYSGLVTVPPGQTTASSGTLLVPGGTDCTGGIRDSGVTSNPGPSLTSSVQVDGGTPAPYRGSVTVESESVYAVDFTFTFADLGAGAPSAPSSGPAAGSGTVTTLPATGADPPMAGLLAVGAALLLATGVLVTWWSRRRSARP